MSKIKYSATILSVLIMSFFVGYMVLAWTEPTAPPPNNNASAPLNVSNTGQYKSGGLTAGASLTPPAAAFYAPAFHDSDELAYFVDPNGPLSNLKGKLQIGNITPGSTTNYLCSSTPTGGDIQSCTAPGGGGGSPLVWRHYFATNTGYTGNLNGVAGADLKCNSDSNALSGRIYKFATTAGAPISDRWDTRITEKETNFYFNKKLGISGSDYTGSASVFVNRPDLNCSDWTSSSGLFTAGMLNTVDTVGTVLWASSQNCSSPRSILCVEIIP